MEADVLILGCGIAGATAALELSRDRERQILVATRGTDPLDSNSTLAQGGIATVGADDTPELLAGDILRAAAGLGYPPAVEILAREGPQRLERILVQGAGVAFDTEAGGAPAFGLEAAHSRRRVLHVGDRTGRAIMERLLAQLRGAPNVTLLPAHTAVDLLTFPHHARDPLATYRPARCHGAYLLDQSLGCVVAVRAAWTVLATGGLGQIFLHTSNPPGARGDGLAMAYRAGARVANAEYVQFHPTALHMPGPTKFLISEAVRGEGAVLLTPHGERFMERYDPERLELAPRDIVARAIYREMLEHGYPYVLLDIASRRPPGFVRERFPAIHRACLEHNLDITRQPIPVIPVAHYFCGGVLVDDRGRSSLEGLFAVGEVACTGVHGANRLASTSLLEGVVWGSRAAEAIREAGVRRPVKASEVPAWDDSGLIYDADPALVQSDMQAIRNLMWHYVGLLRSGYRLERAIRELRDLWLNIEDFYKRARLTDGLVGLRNAVQAGLIVARAALRNRTSRGCHYREDSRPSPPGWEVAAPPEESSQPWSP